MSRASKHRERPATVRWSNHRPVSARGAGAFTLIEVLVTVALLAVAMTAVIQIFNVSSDTTARTVANSDVVAQSAAVREALTDQTAKMYPGLLIIDCPTPTTPRREAHGGPEFMRIRHDRLVFLTSGDVDEYQSFTDPTRADPNPATPIHLKPRTANSSDALVYFGPGVPLTISTGQVRAMYFDDDGDPQGITLTASEWMFLHRSILLLLEVDPNADPSWNPTTMAQVTANGGMLQGGPLRQEFVNGSMDAIVSDNSSNYPASARTISQLVLRKNLDASDLLSENPSIASLWEPSFAPRNVTMENYGFLNHYSRGGSTFVPRLADFRIDWTDGGFTDPLLGPDNIANSGDEDKQPQTRWFGLRPDPNYDVDNSVLNDINIGNAPTLPYVAVRRQDFASGTRADEAAIYGIAPGSQTKIEWSRHGSSSNVNAAYRAIWREDTWAYRPKALRFTYRIYDAGNRLKQSTEVDINENGDFDPDDGVNDIQRRQLTRYGRTFSVIVPIP